MAGINIAPLAAASNTSLLTSSRSSSKLAKAAQEFEGLLLGKWLEKVEECFSGASENQDAGRDTLSSIATQAISSAWSARGGVGLANMLVRRLQPRSDNTKAPEPGSPEKTSAGH